MIKNNFKIATFKAMLGITFVGLVLASGVGCTNSASSNSNNSSEPTSKPVGSVTSSTEISGLDIIASKTSVKFLWTNPTDSDYKGLEIYDEKDNKICHVDKSVQSLERSSLAIDTCYVWSFKTTFGDESKNVSKTVQFKTHPNRKDSGYLGYGYNVLEKGYFNPGDTSKSPILDMGKFKESDIDIRNVSTVETDSVAGKTVSEYVKSLGVKAGISGKYGCFKGDFKSSFKTDESVSEENSYAKALLTVKKK